MGCGSDYMTPTIRERQIKHAAELLVYVYEANGYPVSKKLKSASLDQYGCYDDCFVIELCETIRKMDDSKIQKIVYGNQNPTARKLAVWWDEHKEEDAKRENK